jgi:ADP-heptose:LPS heptosyltransferase
VVLSLPAVLELRRRCPRARIHFLTREPHASLLELCPWIDAVIRLEPGEGVLALARRLRRVRFDAVIDLHSSLRSRLVTAALGRPVWRGPGTHRQRRRMVADRRGASGRRSTGTSGGRGAGPSGGRGAGASGGRGAGPSGGRGTGTTPSLEPVWRVHCRTVERVAEALADALARSPDGAASPEHRPSPEQGARLLEPPRAARDAVTATLPGDVRAVALMPGARWATKRWPARYFAEVAAASMAAGIVPVLLGAPDEAALLEEVCAMSRRASHHADRAAPLPITCAGPWSAIVAWLERCAVAVGNDSGLTHLAEAVGTPVVALFGPTVPAFGFAPRLPASTAVEVPLPCRPCSLHGGARCPLEHHDCLSGLLPERVLTVLRSRGIDVHL